MALVWRSPGLVLSPEVSRAATLLLKCIQTILQTSDIEHQHAVEIDFKAKLSNDSSQGFKSKGWVNLLHLNTSLSQYATMTIGREDPCQSEEEESPTGL